MKTLTMMGDQSNKVTDTSTVFKFVAWNNGVPQYLTGKNVNASIANSSGYLFDEKIEVNGTELDLDFSSDNLKALTPDTYQLEINVSDEQGNTEIYPSDGSVVFTVVKNLKLTQGELVPQITFDSVLQKVDDKVAEYVQTIAKGDPGERGPQGEPADETKLVHTEADEDIDGTKKFNKPIDGQFDWFKKDNYTNISEQFKLTSTAVSPVNLVRVKTLPVVTDALQFQESIIDPRSGYTYLFTNSYYALDSEGKGDLENLYIYEFDQFMRLRSTMRVNHGVDRKTWLHGQFEQFNYYNQNESKVEFLIGNYGQSLKLEYVPNTIVNADDLPVFLTVNETSSHNQAINFDDNKVYAMKGQGKSTDKTYTYDYYEYLLDPQTGKTTFNKQYTINVNTDKGIVHQGLSAAPASSYTNGEHQGTLLFNTSGYTVGTQANELSVRIFLIEDGEISEYADVFNLDQSGFLSTSQHRRTDIISSRNDGIMIYKELEGSSQTKINGSWVFTTLICYDANSQNSPDQPDLPISNRYKGQALLAWSGNQQSLLKTANIGKYQPNTMGLDYDVTDLSAIVYPGHYTLGAKQLPLYTDVPIILSGKDVKTVIGGTGIEEATLDVKVVDSFQRVKQTLNIYTYSVTGQETLTFTRYIRRNMTVGKTDKLTASTWHFEPLNIIGRSNLWPAIKTADDALLPGYQQYISSENIADFFKDAINSPTDAGFFETSSLAIETTSSNTVKLLQRFVTLSDLKKYERVVEANVTTTTVFPHGIGGGYPSVKSIGDWVKI